MGNFRGRVFWGFPQSVLKGFIQKFRLYYPASNIQLKTFVAGTFVMCSIQEQFKALIKGLNNLKKQVRNRDDPQFKMWYAKALNAVEQYAPIKLPAFEEIPFASDFFLSKAIIERDDINDRIALVSDAELARQILEEALLHVESEEAKQKREVLRSLESVYSFKEPISGFSEICHQQFEVNWENLQHFLKKSVFSQREQDDAREILRNLEQTLSRTDPDWDHIKRGIKFLLDFDRQLAVKAIPFLFSLYQLKQGPDRL